MAWESTSPGPVRKISRILREVEDPDEYSPPEKKVKSDNATDIKSLSAEQPAKQYSFKSALNQTYGEYCTESTIHGISYIYLERGLKSKLFWIILISASLITCLIMINAQYHRWKRAPVVISFSESPIPVSKIPFPAITICSETKARKTPKINFTKFFNYLQSQGENIIEPPPWLNDHEFRHMRALLQVCGNYLVKDMNFPEYPPMIVEDHLNELIEPFEKVFFVCKFNRTIGDCSQLFEKIYTEEGICYSFNALNESEIYRENTHQYKYFQNDSHIRIRNESLEWDITEGFIDPDDYDTYPERVIGCGVRSGLDVAMEEKEENLDHVCRQPVQGFKLILHSPDDVPQVDKHFIHVPYERDVLILVKPHFVYNTEDIDDYPVEERQCYFPDERKLQFFQFYTQNKCEIECLANFTLRICGCVQFSMPRLSNTKVCDASKITCYDKAENDFLLSEYTGLNRGGGAKCNCLPGCFVLHYNHELSQGIFNPQQILQALNHNATEHINESMISRVRVNFKTNEFTARKRAELFGLTDFLANCGGLFGLFVGASALSLMELFYHFTVRLYQNIQEMKRNN